MAGAAPASSRWIFGRAPDLLLGCGLGYVLLAAAAAVAPVARVDLLTVGILSTFIVGMPHYGATLLRVYERSEDRRRYVIFAVWISLVVWGFFVAGVYNAAVGSAFLTLYLTWSPWHYTGQNYGIAVMYLRRAGVPLEPRTKRLLYASFLLSYLMALLGLHSAGQISNYGPDIIGETYHFLSLRIPAQVSTPLFGAALAAYVIALVAGAASLLRGSRPAQLGPAAALVGLQALWFVVPSVALWWTGTSPTTSLVFFFFIWVAIGHSVQYLWITTFYAAASEPLGGRLRYLTKALAAGAFIWTVPALIFAPSLLGEVPYRVGLYMMVASAVNIHHFMLDGAIWKLRGPVARILLGSPSDGEAASASGTWTRRLVWSACAASLVIALGAESLYQFVWVPAARTEDEARAARVERWLGWVGREEPEFHEWRGARALVRGDLDTAAHHYQAGLELHPTSNGWLGMAEVHRRRGDHFSSMRCVEQSLGLSPSADAWATLGQLRTLDGNPDGSIEAYRTALELDPDHVVALHAAGRYWLEEGRLRRARRLLERAAAIDPANPRIRADLSRAAEPQDG